MKFQLLDEVGERRHYLLVFAPGDRVVEELLAFGRDRNLTGAVFTGIGAFRQATLAYFNPDTHQYDEFEIDEQVELLSIIGNLARYQGQLRSHAHVVLARPDGSALGGHLMEAVVRPTLELSLIQPSGELTRADDDTFGIPLLAPGS